MAGSFDQTIDASKVVWRLRVLGGVEVVTLPCLVVVAQHAPAFVDQRERVLQMVRAASDGVWDAPDPDVSKVVSDSTTRSRSRGTAFAIVGAYANSRLPSTRGPIGMQGRPDPVVNAGRPQIQASIGYRHRCCQDRAADTLGNIAGRHDARRYAEKLAQFALDRAEVEEGRLRCWIHQDIQITAIRILTGRNRPEYSWIRGTVRLDDPPYNSTMLLQGD